MYGDVAGVMYQALPPFLGGETRGESSGAEPGNATDATVAPRRIVGATEVVTQPSPPEILELIFNVAAPVCAASAAAAQRTAGAADQGLTLVNFSAQRKHNLWNTSGA